MKVTLLYFASVREATGCASETIEQDEGASVQTVKQWLQSRYPSLNTLLMTMRIAIDEEFVSDEAQLTDGCQIAFIPPVSGGIGCRAALTHQPITNDAAQRMLSTQGAGAVITFTGIVRPTSKQGRQVDALDYEAYESMALKKLEQCVNEACAQSNILDAAIVHRLGHLTLGEIAVSVTVASKHRKEAFEAAQYIIDRLKEIVPIWKRETGPDGVEWVSEGA